MNPSCSSSCLSLCVSPTLICKDPGTVSEMQGPGRVHDRLPRCSQSGQRGGCPLLWPCFLAPVMVALFVCMSHPGAPCWAPCSPCHPLGQGSKHRAGRAEGNTAKQPLLVASSLHFIGLLTQRKDRRNTGWWQLLQGCERRLGMNSEEIRQMTLRALVITGHPSACLAQC